MSSQNLGKLVSSLTDPSFGIPTDVTFQIMSVRCDEDVEKNETVSGEVKGHKLILGMFSPVFKSEFFGSLKETQNVIPVRQTTLEAFKTMFDYIYQQESAWSRLSMLELYDVVNLAEKYDVSGLMEELRLQMTTLPLTLEGLMDVADTAAQFTQFPAIFSTLLLTCAKFLKKTLRTPAKLLQFGNEHAGSGQGDTFIQLMGMVNTLSVNSKCNDC